MNYWKEMKINFGSIKRNTSKKIIFEALPDIPEIKGITASCGCTTFKYNKEDGTLKIIYKAKDIPVHITGNQSVIKYIHVTYEDGTQDTLTLTGVKTRF